MTLLSLGRSNPVATTSQRLTSLESAVASLTTRVKSLESSRTTLTARTTKLEADVANLTVQMGGPTSQVNAPATVSAGTGAANQHRAAVKATAGAPAGTGAAQGATVSTSIGTDPAWVGSWPAALRAAMTPPSYTTTTMAPGSYTMAQVQSALAAMGSGTSSVWKRLVVASCTITQSGNGLDLSAYQYVIIDGVTRATSIWNNQATSAVGNYGHTFFIRAPGNHIAIWNLSIIGEATLMGTPEPFSQHTGAEGIGGVVTRASTSYIHLKNVYMTKIRGWPMYNSLDDGGNLPYGIWVQNCAINGGQSSMAPVCVERYLVEDSSFADPALYHIDFEPEPGGTQGYRDALIQRNTFGDFGWSTIYTNWWIAANPNPAALSSSVMDRLTVIGNTITGQDRGVPGRGGFLVRINKENIKNDTYIMNNHANVARTLSSTGTEFNAMTNLVLTGNYAIIPSHGSLYLHSPDATNVPDTGVTSSPNTT